MRDVFESRVLACGAEIPIYIAPVVIDSVGIGALCGTLLHLAGCFAGAKFTWSLTSTSCHRVPIAHLERHSRKIATRVVTKQSSAKFRICVRDLGS